MSEGRGVFQPAVPTVWTVEIIETVLYVFAAEPLFRTFSGLPRRQTCSIGLGFLNEGPILLRHLCIGLALGRGARAGRAGRRRRRPNFFPIRLRVAWMFQSGGANPSFCGFLFGYPLRVLSFSSSKIALAPGEGEFPKQDLLRARAARAAGCMVPYDTCTVSAIWRMVFHPLLLSQDGGPNPLLPSATLCTLSIFKGAPVAAIGHE